jgi:hypothetical protein
LTVGIEEVRAAGRAEIHRSDIVRRKPCGQELISGNGNQIKMNGGRAGDVLPWQLHIGEGDRTPFGMQPARFGWLAKELVDAREAPLKGFLHLVPHFIATHADGRTQHSQQALRLRSIHAAHPPHGLFDDACQRATPPCMNCRHGSTLRVYQQHGQTIGGSDRQQDTSLIGQQRITCRLGNARLFRYSFPTQAVLEFAGGCPPNLIDSGGMDLPEGSQHEMFRAKLLEEKFPIFPHPYARLAFCESEVEPRRRAPAHPAPAGTECMHQPGITGDEGVLNPGQPATRDDL